MEVERANFNQGVHQPYASRELEVACNNPGNCECDYGASCSPSHCFEYALIMCFQYLTSQAIIPIDLVW